MLPLRRFTPALLLPACTVPAEPLWLADRGTGELVALDEELHVVAHVPLASARLVVPGQGDEHDGVLWVASDERSDPARDRLVRVDPRAEPRAIACAEIVALCAEPGARGVLVLERASTRETHLWRVGEDLRRVLLAAFDDACALAADGREILVGRARGELLRLRADGAVAARGDAGATVRALAPGPRAGEWWLLAGTSTVALLGRDLAPSWSVDTGLDTSAFAPVAGEERIWLAAEGELRGYGPDGRLEVAEHFAGGPWTAWRATRTSVHLAGVGAVLELAVRGPRVRALRSQGGFAHLAGA